jgi:CDP-glycerol glycerophosphotransferase (TagB/SpsB family)
MHEWAKAYKLIQQAEQHIERAKLKMEFRSERFPAKEKQYKLAYELNEFMIKNLEDISYLLLLLIDVYGIKVGEKYSKTLQKYLTVPKLQPVEEWVKKN